MPITLDDEDGRQTQRTVLSGPSIACDLSWVIHVATRPSWKPRFPALTEYFESRPDLVERVLNFWPEQSDLCFTEMVCLANHAGALGETNPEVLWPALSEAAKTIPTDLGLESEDPDERLIFLDRLQQLKDSPELMANYIKLLADLWAPVNERWQAALPELELAGRIAKDRIERGGLQLGMTDSTCAVFQAHLPEINERMNHGYPLLIAPCYFFGKSLYLEFPGVTVIGSGFTNNDLGARARTKALAIRLKTVADPTRLALLHFLAGAPSTVSDLATSFDLAQPTVSMHIKSLRESGLVRAERQAGKMQLSADPDAVERLLSELREVVVQGANTTGNERIPATVVDATRSTVPVTV
jgi:DNA-binding transcriptional ArsR family regulator